MVGIVVVVVVVEVVVAVIAVAVLHATGKGLTKCYPKESLNI